MNLLALLACSCNPEGASTEVVTEVAPRPDIVLITLDTTRADRLGCYGHELADTPTIDGLCNAGRRYSRAYSPAPLTIPAHAAIFTGQHPADLGIRDNGDGRLEASALTLTEVLKAHGYQTAAAVTAFVTTRTWGFNQGFDVYFDDVGREAGSIWQSERRGEEAVDDLLGWAETRDPTRPSFAWLHLYDAHFPYAPPDAYWEEWNERPYDGELAYVDDQLARVTAVFDPATTLFVIVSDHGEGLGDHDELTHGLYVYDSTQHVPFIVSGPGIDPSVVDDVVSLMDVTPTILAQLDIPPPEGIQGQAMPGGESRPVYMEAWALMNRFGFSPHVGVVDGDYKYIGTTDPELYDLKADPGETLMVDDEARLTELASVLATFDYDRPGNSRIATDPATAMQLQSLGYIEGAFVGDLTGTLPDPKPHAEDILASQKADKALRRGELKEAEALLRELMTKYPQALEFHSRLAGVIARQGRPDEAAAILEAALATAPGEPSLQAALGVHRARQGDYAAATELFQSAAESLPWAPGLRAMAVASQLSVAGEEGKAVQLGVRYLEAYPDDYAVAGLLGVVFAKLGAPEARQLLETGVKADRPEAEVAFLLGLAVMAEEDDQRAATLFAKELEHYPRNLEAAQAYISVLDRAKDYEGILNVSSAALLHNPTDLPLLHAKAQSLFNLKHFDVCRTELDLARAQHPKASSLMLLDANLLSKEGKNDEGALLFEKAKAAKDAEDAAG